MATNKLKLLKLENEQANKFDTVCKEFESRKSIYDLAKIEKDTFSEQLKHDFLVVEESCKVQGVNYLATFSVTADKYAEVLDLKGIEITKEIEQALNLLRASGVIKTKVTKGTITLKDVKQV